MKKLALIAVATVVLVGAGVTTFLLTRGPSAEEVAAAKAAAINHRQKRCTGLVGDFEDKMLNISARLDTGVNQSEFTTLLGDASVALTKTDVDAIRADEYCRGKVMVPLVKAFQTYDESNTTWRDCIADYNCNLQRDKMPGIQKKWAQASVGVNIGKVMLADYRPQPSEKYVPENAHD